MFKCCFNRKVLIGLAIVAGGLLLLAPGTLRSAGPLLFIAVCPLSMLLMMRGMSRGTTTSCPTTPAGTKTTAEIDKDAEIARLTALLGNQRRMTDAPKSN